MPLKKQWGLLKAIWRWRCICPYQEKGRWRAPTYRVGVGLQRIYGMKVSIQQRNSFKYILGSVKQHFSWAFTSPTTSQRRRPSEQGRKNGGNTHIGHTHVGEALRLQQMKPGGKEKLHFSSEFLKLHRIILLINCCTGMTREIFIWLSRSHRDGRASHSQCREEPALLEQDRMD